MKARNVLFKGLAVAAASLQFACGGGGSSAPPPAPVTYTVTYSGNGSTGGSVPVDTGAYQQGQTVTVLGNSGALVKTGSSFSGWNTAAAGTGTAYAQGQTFAIGASNVTLYAQWTAGAPTYKVTYNGNGSTGGTVPVDPTAYQAGQTVTVAGNTGSLTKTGDTFSGWNTAAAGTGTAYTAGQTFTIGSADVTLYAQWPATSVVGHAFTVNQYSYSVSQFTIGTNGVLTLETPASVPTEVDPNALAVDPAGKYLYVVNLKGGASNTGGSISQYTIGANGTLTAMSPTSVGAGSAPTAIVVHPSGKWAYAPSSKNPGAAVVQYAIGANGGLTSTASVLLPGGFPQFLVIDPSGTHLYVAIQSGTDGIAQYAIDQTTGALTALSPAAVAFNATGAAGGTAFAITVDPSGKYLYETDYYGAISEYTIDPTTGALAPLAATTVAGTVQGAAWITVDPSGKYAYVANPGSTTDGISQFTVGSNGILSPMTPPSVATTGTTNIQVDPTGTYVYATSGLGNTATNEVFIFKIGTNGTLTPASPASVSVGGSASGPNAVVLTK